MQHHHLSESVSQATGHIPHNSGIVSLVISLVSFVLSVAVPTLADGISAIYEIRIPPVIIESLQAGAAFTAIIAGIVTIRRQRKK